MPGPLENKFVVLGVTGSIACYKAVDLASRLTQDGALVTVALSDSATNFVSPLTFRGVTQRPVVTSLWDTENGAPIKHVEMAELADIIVIAPATANTIAKLASGLSNDPITATVLGTRAPVLIAPAMDSNMYENPATQENVSKLKERGFVFVGPAKGRFASGHMGTGRLIEPQELIGHVRTVLGFNGRLARKKIVVSAGGTQEDVDPVRFIGNRSSGKMGYAIAEGARDHGADTVLVAGPTSIPDPVGVRVRHVKTSLEMLHAVTEESVDAKVVIMAAAVADWTPRKIFDQKVKKHSLKTWTLELAKTSDILTNLPANGLIKVGFAAESENIDRNAKSKIKSKGLHLVAANDISDKTIGFGSDHNRVILYDCDGGKLDLGLRPKYEIGLAILDRITSFLEQ